MLCMKGLNRRDILSVECNELDRKQAPIVGIVACIIG